MARPTALALALACLASAASLAGCGDNLAPPTGEVATFPATPGSDLDILFVMDADSGALDLQSPLAASLPVALVAGLQASPGGLPNLHIGVTTSDLGTTGSLARGTPAPPAGATCSGSSDAGKLVTRGAPGITPPSDPYISDIADGSGGRTVNYAGTLADMLSSILQPATGGGCVFTQSLAAAGLALGGANPGFRRPDASLAIIVVSDRDDCSVRDSAMFGSDSPGPLSTFRCAVQGVVCAEPVDGGGTKSDCEPVDGNRYVENLSDLEVGVDSAAPDPTRRMVATITGPASPFVVSQSPTGDVVSPSCTAPSTATAEPAVRDAAWATALGGQSYSICDGDFTATATALARQMTTVLVGDPCIRGALAPEVACTVTEGETPVPECPASGNCYELVTDTATCGDTLTHLRVQIDRTTPAASDATIHVTCELAR